MNSRTGATWRRFDAGNAVAVSVNPRGASYRPEGMIACCLLGIPAGTFVESGIR